MNARIARAMYARVACVEEKFWGRVHKGAAEGCWEFSGATNPAGYGLFLMQAPEKPGPWKNTQLIASRVAWMLANRAEVPAGMFVLHSCDNPPCCNPAHLRVGTHQDNMDDKATRLRTNRAKLTPSGVAAIRRRRVGGATLAALSAEFGVSLTTIHRVCTGDGWRHVA